MEVGFLAALPRISWARISKTLWPHGTQCVSTWHAPPGACGFFCVSNDRWNAMGRKNEGRDIPNQSIQGDFYVDVHHRLISFSTSKTAKRLWRLWNYNKGWEVQIKSGKVSCFASWDSPKPLFSTVIFAQPDPHACRAGGPTYRYWWKRNHVEVLHLSRDL